MILKDIAELNSWIILLIICLFILHQLDAWLESILLTIWTVVLEIISLDLSSWYSRLWIKSWKLTLLSTFFVKELENVCNYIPLSLLNPILIPKTMENFSLTRLFGLLMILTSIVWLFIRPKKEISLLSLSMERFSSLILEQDSSSLRLFTQVFGPARNVLGN